MTGTLLEYQNTFLVVPRSFLRRIINVPVYRGNQNINFIFNNSCSKIVPFMR
jgi:hypothetical protein